jgi:hypothetical protein
MEGEEFQDDERMEYSGGNNQNYRMIESTVVVKDDKGEVVKRYTLNVEIEFPSKVHSISLASRKPYLGGFRNAKNGVVLHHAYAQTDQIRRVHKVKYTRDVTFLWNVDINLRLFDQIEQGDEGDGYPDGKGGPIHRSS